MASFPSVIALLGLSLLVIAQAGAAIEFGGVLARAQLLWGLVAACGAVLIWIYGFVLSKRAPGSPIVVWLVLAGVGLGAVQLSRHLPVVSWLGAPQLALQQQLTDDGQTEPNTRWSSQQRPSLYPHATRRDMAALAVIGMIVLAASAAIRTPSGAAVVLIGPALGGAALATYGLLLQIAGDPAVIASRPLLPTSFATFVNPNNAGGYFNLCLAASLGVAWWTFANKSEELKLQGARTLRERWHRILFRLRWELASLNARKFAALTLVGLCAAATICTLSRGAIVALVGGSLFTVLIVLLGRRSLAGVLAGGAVLSLGIGLTAWVGMTEQVTAELATLVEEDAAASRMELWSSVLPLASRYGVLGTGLGTFRYAYRPFLAGVDRVWFYHAENQFVEALTDGGFLGLGLLIAALGIAIWQTWRLIRSGNSRRFVALGIATMFALITQAIQATCDFGLYLPSNGWLLAVLVGAALGARSAQRAQLEAASNSDASTPRDSTANDAIADDSQADKSSGRRAAKQRSIRRSQATEAGSSESRGSGGYAWMPVALWLLVTATVAWALVDHWRAHQAENAIAAIDVDLDTTLVDSKTLDAWQQQLRSAAVQSGSAEAWEKLADLQIARFRLNWMESILPREAGEADRQTLWPALSLVELHRRLAIASSTDGEAGVTALLVSCGGSQALLQADDSLRRARRACPINATSHLKLAQTCATWEPLGADARHLDRALQWAPNRPEFLTLAGLLDLNQNRVSSATERWRKALELDRSQQVNLVSRFALSVLPVSQVASEIVPDSPAMQIEIARGLDRRQVRPKQLRDALLARAEQTLSQRTRSAEDDILLGRVYREQSRWAEASQCYEEALASEPYEKQWRFEFVETLVEKQEWERARNEINRVLMLDNDWQPALALRDRIRKELLLAQPSTSRD